MNKELLKKLTVEDYAYLSEVMYRGVIFLRNIHEGDVLSINEKWSIVKEFIDNDLDGKDLFSTLRDEDIKIKI